MRKRNPVAERLLVEIERRGMAMIAEIKRIEALPIPASGNTEREHRLADLDKLTLAHAQMLGRCRVLVKSFSPASDCDDAGEGPALTRRGSELDQSPAKGLSER